MAKEDSWSDSGVQVIAPGVAGLALVVRHNPPSTVPTMICAELLGLTAILWTAPLTGSLGGVLALPNNCWLCCAGPCSTQLGTPTRPTERSSRFSRGSKTSVRRLGGSFRLCRGVIDKAREACLVKKSSAMLIVVLHGGQAPPLPSRLSLLPRTVTVPVAPARRGVGQIVLR